MNDDQLKVQRMVEPRPSGVVPGALPRLLILSNGHGEDSMGALLAAALRERQVDVTAFPLVGEGGAYQAAKIRVSGVQAVMPSGGFILEGSTAVWRDIQAGLLKLTWRQIMALRSMRREFDYAVGVGDVYPLAMNACFLRLPFTFIPTAKSDYIRGHYQWEAALMRRTCRQVFPRDAKTAQSLQAQGVPAEYLGNMMMDAMGVTGRRFGDDRPVVGILPGSRAPEAYNNTLMMLAVVEQLVQSAAKSAPNGQTPQFVLAMAGSLSHTELAAAVRGRNWRWQAAEAHENAQGIVGRLVFSDAQTTVLLVRGRFGDVLANSCVVLGMSGTGNEQAAGMGVPVVTMPGPGPQFTSRFAQDQHRLLGDAVWVVEDGPSAAAQVIAALLLDPHKRAEMGNIGRARMGLPGATARMADRISAQAYAYAHAHEHALVDGPGDDNRGNRQ